MDGNVEGRDLLLKRLLSWDYLELCERMDAGSGLGEQLGKVPSSFSSIEVGGTGSCVDSELPLQHPRQRMILTLFTLADGTPDAETYITSDKLMLGANTFLRVQQARSGLVRKRCECFWPGRNTSERLSPLCWRSAQHCSCAAARRDRSSQRIQPPCPPCLT